MKRALLWLIAAGLSAQSFEVASIKPNHTGDRRSGFPVLRNGLVKADNVSLKTLIFVAYGVSGTRIVGPDWLDNEKFDLAARASEGAPDSALMPLMRALLEERFHASCHRETRDTAAYDLVADKSGPKLTPFDPAHPLAAGPNNGGSLLIGVGTTAQIADMLARPSGRPVVDKTGIDGRFAYKIAYSPLSADGSNAADSGPPDIFAAVRQQLGLRLDPNKEPIEFLIVDRIDRLPLEN